MIWVFLIIVIWVLYIVFGKKISNRNRVQEFPNFTLNIVGKIFYEKDEEYEHEVIVVLYQNELKTVIGIDSEKFIKVKKDAIVAQEDTGEVGVYIDAMRVGYLNADSAKEFCNFIKTKNLSKNDAFDVEAIIIGNPKGDKWYVKLNMPSKMQKFRYKIY
ncbi:hypothetical protein BJD20_06630 [Acinetobacter proteolyticus]|uniref:HIRAN domain-containing protein n=1 Tax=Acinetobacter vivianii TaxID=1776742 RepID=N8UZF8_9GAMM|nr:MULTISPECIES: hypothetical protein [Acinetobacter]ENU92765.1 hypothetical protein F971_01752 [Acinetobacter vivianii]OEY93011.1 hypothetical protein BJD20_06630 [Acinetobacter proteolyticus]